MEISILISTTMPDPSPNSDYALNKAHRKRPETQAKNTRFQPPFFSFWPKQNTTFPSPEAIPILGPFPSTGLTRPLRFVVFTFFSVYL